MSVRDACKRHQELTDRERELHRSAMYRLLRAGKIEGEWRGGELRVDLDSLEAYCAPRPARVAGASRPSDSRQAEAAVERMSRRHGVRTPKGGGTR